jgi:hypothetical protein
MLNTEDLAILKKQEAQGKISIHLDPFYSSSQPTTEASTSTMFAPLDPHTYTPSGFVYTQLPPDTTQNNKPSIPHTHTIQTIHREPQQPYIPHPRQPSPRDHANQFNLSIARPKLDFPSFNGDEQFNWLRQCEKYFALASVPMDTWVSLATLHCHGTAQTWWRSLRTPSTYIH